MSRTPDEISAAIRATLATTEPGLSCERGTPERKIIDACSEAISEAYVDMYLIGSLLDLDNKVGFELEQFVGIFGFGRLSGKQATGVIRMSVATPMVTDQVLPRGSQFYTRGGLAVTGGNRVYFSSTQAVVLTAGSYTVDIPVQCNEPGTMGNVPPDSVTSFGSTINSSTVTNLVAFSGGVDRETDAELRQRFKDTMLRNIAGTSDWYQAICLQNNRVSRVVVFGPTTMFRTQITAPLSSKNLSGLDPENVKNIKYVWPDMESVFTDLGQENEIFYRPGGDYTLNWPTFTRVANANGGQIANGQVVDLEFQYTTRSSRNEPGQGITNKVDIFVDGVEPLTVTEKTVITSTDVLVESPTSAWNCITNFERVGSPGDPQAGSRFVRLASTPIVSFPSSLAITTTAGATDVYTLGTHYHLLRSTTTLAGSHQEIAGIEWPAGLGPPSSTELTLTYIYNRVPEMLTAVISTAKQICTDVMVHQARWQYITVCLSVQYAQNQPIDVTKTSIENQLTSFFSAMRFGQQVKITSLLLAVQQVLGVENVTLTTASENDAHYGVEVAYDPTEESPTRHESDFRLDDNAIPTLQGVHITRRAAV